MKTFIQGFDVSHHNGVFDFEKMAAQNNKFCFIKATDGAAFVDPQFKANWDKAPRAGLLVGAYHFFRASVDPEIQANHFLSVKGPNRIGDLPCVLDFETLDGISIGAAKKNALIFMAIVESATGKTPIFYSYRDFIMNCGDWSDFRRFPLWLAVYRNKVISPATPEPWQKWTFWQYTDSNGLDLDVCNGSMSLADLKGLAGIT